MDRSNEMPLVTPPRLEVGGFVIDFGREALLDGGGVVVELRPQAFRVLRYLALNAGRLVTKEELLGAVWPGAVVTDDSVIQAIVDVRHAFAEAGRSVIKTIPRRGYILVKAAAPTPSRHPDPVALPAPPPSFLGRDEDVAALESLMSQHRLITVTGAGGIGKTAFALSLAHGRKGRQHGRVVWVDLAAVSDPRLICSTVAQALQMSLGGTGNPLASFVTALRPLRLLLILDNAEHVAQEVARMAQAILTGCDDVRMLVTSQAALKVEGERLFRLDALAVPATEISADMALGYGAVALFVDQAKAADRSFSLNDSNVGSVIALCCRLEGNALAIKLAAARLPLLGLPGLHARLAERFKVLGGGPRTAPVRQQTLLSAMEWSHGLLSAQEQAVFRRLGVFSGGFSLDLAVAIAGDDTHDEWAVLDVLQELTDRSFVMTDGQDAPRYRLLESAREYALLKLDEACERNLTNERQARALLLLFEQSYEGPWGSSRYRLAQFKPELDNLRLTLDWCAENDAPLGVALVGASSELFLHLSLRYEARQRFAMFEPSVTSAIPPAIAARYWQRRCLFVFNYRSPLVYEFAVKATELHRKAGDESGLYTALGYAVMSAGASVDESRAMLIEMERLEHSDWPFNQLQVRMFAQLSLFGRESRHLESRSLIKTALSCATARGLKRWVAVCMMFLTDTTLALGDAEEAVRFAREALAGNRLSPGPFIISMTGGLAAGLLVQGRVAEARLALVEFFEASRSREWDYLSVFADVFALFAAREGRPETAARLIGYSDKVNQLSAGLRVSHDRVLLLAKAAVEVALERSAIERLMADGHNMDEEEVCAVTLGDAGESRQV
ncbi:MAG: hypothetical protein EOP82_05580 [Variovorax sp.]|nr:MAG: hypothetical protein EOP82_05580 [Variovorax sp.]